MGITIRGDDGQYRVISTDADGLLTTTLANTPPADETYRFSEFVINQRGQPIANVQATVYLAGTQVLAAIYDEAGVALTNPVLTSTLGYFEFYAASGIYDIVFSRTNVTTWTLKDVTLGNSGTSVNWITNLGSITGAISIAPLRSIELYTALLVGNVTVTFDGSRLALGALVAFRIKQDGTGGRTFTWPAAAVGATAVGSDPNQSTYQLFMWDGTNLLALGPGVLNP